VRVDSNDHRAVVREFLSSRRGRLTPQQVGLPDGGRRRVPGLRREEVAMLAGVSTEWYTRLEKGHIAGMSEEVLDAVARALQLDVRERAYLLDLARAARPARRARVLQEAAQLPDQVQWMVDSMTLSAAVVTNSRWDVVVSNPLARALFSPLLQAGQMNIARHIFLDPQAHDFYADWAAAADAATALLLTEGGRRPGDDRLQELICELLSEPEFRTRWDAHDVLIHHRGNKTFRHPDVGVLEVSYASMELPTPHEEGLRFTTYTAEPGSSAEEKLRLLASWAAPVFDQAERSTP
jgi:transcriptional regulator with XRE-family HTH domain